MPFETFLETWCVFVMSLIKENGIFESEKSAVVRLKGLRPGTRTT